MQIQTTTLGNGLRVLLMRNDSQVVHCGYMFLAGSSQEEAGELGIAHFCEHTTYKGTQRRTAWHVHNYLESVGGVMQAYTSKEETAFYASVLKDYIPRAIDLLTDMVFHSTYPEQELEKEKDVVLEEIESQPASERIFDDLENMLFPQHPLGHFIYGTKELLRNFTTEQVRHFARRWYRPDNAVFFLLGDVTMARVTRLLERATADQPAASPVDLSTIDRQSLQPLEKGEVRKQTNSSVGEDQACVIFGGRTFGMDDVRRPALDLLTNYLGGVGMNAKLNLELRGHHGLVYTVYAEDYHYARNGVWDIYLECSEDDVERCRKLVRRVLDKMMNQPLSSRQLAAAKKQRVGQIGMEEHYGEDYALGMAKHYLFLGRLRDNQAFCQRIMQLTPDDIQQMAQWLFDPDRMDTLIYNSYINENSGL